MRPGVEFTPMEEDADLGQVEQQQPFGTLVEVKGSQGNIQTVDYPAVLADFQQNEAGKLVIPKALSWDNSPHLMKTGALRPSVELWRGITKDWTKDWQSPLFIPSPLPPNYVAIFDPVGTDISRAFFTEFDTRLENEKFFWTNIYNCTAQQLLDLAKAPSNNTLNTTYFDHFSKKLSAIVDSEFNGDATVQVKAILGYDFNGYAYLVNVQPETYNMTHVKMGAKHEIYAFERLYMALGGSLFDNLPGVYFGQGTVESQEFFYWIRFLFSDDENPTIDKFLQTIENKTFTGIPSANLEGLKAKWMDVKVRYESLKTYPLQQHTIKQAAWNLSNWLYVVLTEYIMFPAVTMMQAQNLQDMIFGTNMRNALYYKQIPVAEFMQKTRAALNVNTNKYASDLLRGINVYLERILVENPVAVIPELTTILTPVTKVDGKYIQRQP